MLRQYKLKDYNFRLVLWVVTLSVLGVLLVGSADSSLQGRQFMGVMLGVTLMVVLSLIDFSWILGFYWYIYILDVSLLALTLVVGWATHGARRWIDLGFTRFQPVELSKLLLVLFFAAFFLKHENDLSKFKTVIQAAALIGLPLVLIIAEPDLKNTITITAVFCLIYFAAGLNFRVILTTLAIAAALIVVFLSIVVQPDQKIIEDYQRNRIMAFIYRENDEYSDDNAQQNNSVTAIGSGELTGKGLNNSSVSSANKGNFIPEIQNDFIFAVAGEELGFVGSAGIVILLLLIVLECLFTSRKAKDLSGVVICSGVASVIAIQSFINIGVATGMLPNTGTPLPFVSYGLSSLESMFMGIGFVLNVGLQNRVRLEEVRHARSIQKKKQMRSRYVRRD